MKSLFTTILTAATALAPLTTLAADADEFRVKRQEVFEFTEQPHLVRKGRQFLVRFTVKAFCDVTVAIEDNQGRIVRHLASGVLGDNAPPPLVKGSLQQEVPWDGKDDQERYIDRLEDMHVRVSLGLKPQFERNLYWSPYKRIGEAVQLIQAAPEGVYVYDGRGIDHVRLYDHDGVYLRTIHPFPADKLDQVFGLNREVFPQSGQNLPIKNSLYQQTLLSCGDNASRDDRLGMSGTAASAIARHGKRIYLAKLRLNRLAADGSSGGLDLNGPTTAATLVDFKIRYKRDNVEIPPTSMAASPDGRWLYLSGYAYRYSFNFHCLSCVYRLPADGDGELELFAGGEGVDGFGEGDLELKVATSVDCDAQGRVYVGDYMNDRVKVFSPDRQLLKVIPVNKPAQVRIDRRTGELYVFSWLVCNDHLYRTGREGETTVIDAKLSKFGPLEDPQLRQTYDLPWPRFEGRYSTFTGIEHALPYYGEVDVFTDPPTIWLARDNRQDHERGIHKGNGGRNIEWSETGIRLLRPTADGTLETIRDFGKLVIEDPHVVRPKPPSNAIQRLYPHPISGKLYVGEADSGATIKAFRALLEVDPETGRVKVIELPFNALEAAFDFNNMLYLRTTNVVARYDFGAWERAGEWQEVPFDYGEELPQVGCGIFGRFSAVKAGLVMPSMSPVCFHQGGFNVNARGDIVASCAYRYSGDERKPSVQFEKGVGGEGEQLFGQPYTPRAYPGRVFSSTGAAIHVWDKHGQMIYDDAVPGVPQMDGIGLDARRNIYIMATPTRVLDGQKHFNEMSETMMKLRPHQVKVVSTNNRAPVPLSPEGRPQRPPDLHNSTLKEAWVDNADWFYGGVGFAGFNPSRAGGGCACWFARCTLEHFARSFAPETLHFSVAVLDSAGNLITRVGRYGNVDSAGQDCLVPLPGDGVGLFHACYVGSHTDHRLFISDVGNARIVSVKLNYHETATVDFD